ncbi:MAG TPA: TonB-dependent receptor, partial [Gemmatimonadaceae bacterium]|nr:TonB-dependent receptor [Gemmatimonadaceae bacterium]
MLKISNRSVRQLFTLLGAVVAMLAAIPSLASAQGGTISGTVTGADSRPIADAQVVLVNTSYRAISDAVGAFTISGVPSGRYELRVQRIGEQPRNVIVEVVSGSDTRADVQLTRAPLELGGVVISASRRAEKITDAPATVTRIEATAIDNSAGGNGFAAALKGAKGLDFLQVGMTSVAVNARGFNSSFNNRMLLTEDGRISVLPESGLPLGAMSSIPKVDLASAEVLVGPGSALYGPDASNGVITLSTRDPRAFPGLTVELTGGNRSYRDIQGRYGWAGGAFGAKISGEYQAADDFESYLNYGPVAPRTTRTPEVGTSWNTSTIRGNGSLIWYGAPGRLEFNSGYAEIDGVGQTSAGRNQLDGYNAGHVQARFTNPRIYANAYRISTGSGDTYAINAFSQNKLAFPTLTDDSIKSFSGFPGGGTLTAGEIQGNYELLGTRFIAGGQIRQDVVTSKRIWLSDRLTGQDVEIGQRGVYAQTETPLGRMLRVVLAARYDDHDRYAEQFSPKGSILFTPVTDQTFRVTVNRAYKAPSILQTDFYYPDFARLGAGLGIGVLGNQGLTVRNAAGVIEQTYDPIKPERNTTVELGYKGILANKLFIDITGYQSKFKDFLT